jgi:iron complex outermembrane recepter protein
MQSMTAEFFNVPERDVIERPCDTATPVEPAGSTAFLAALHRSAGGSMAMGTAPSAPDLKPRQAVNDPVRLLSPVSPKPKWRRATDSNPAASPQRSDHWAGTYANARLKHPSIAVALLALSALGSSPAFASSDKDECIEESRTMVAQATTAPAGTPATGRCKKTSDTAGRNAGNAITQAGDAFGTSVGRESIGIYTAGSVRGFSAIAAGNVRINSLYFDHIYPLSPMMRESTTIRVGLSAVSDPFPAPTGIVDYTLLDPKNVVANSFTATVDAWGGASMQIDRDQPLGKTLALSGALGAYRNEFRNGTNNFQTVGAITAKWQPSEAVTIQPFWQHARVQDDDTGALYSTAGNFLPPRIERRKFRGPSWLDYNGSSEVVGIVANYAMSPLTAVQAGVFRSIIDTETDAANLYVGIDEAGRGRQIAIIDPPSIYQTTSGEARMSHAFGRDSKTHRIQFNLRGRHKRRSYDGSDEIDLGPVVLNEERDVPQPEFSFQEQSSYELRQFSGGIAYRGRWGKFLEVNSGLQRTIYRKTIRIPGFEEATTNSRSWLYNTTFVATLHERLTMYAGVVNGLEENGVAPANAVNRNQPLPAIETSQRDLGLRWQINPDIRLVLGAFSLEKPYFQLDQAGLYEPLGSVTSRGVEFSLSGTPRRNITLVTGGAILQAEVDAPLVSTGRIGSHPVGLPNRTLRLNMDWKPEFAKGALSFDLGVAHTSSRWANSANSLQIPATTILDVGGRYMLRRDQHQMLLRLVVSNVFDEYGYSVVASGLYDTIPGRQATLTLTTNF